VGANESARGSDVPSLLAIKMVSYEMHMYTCILTI
jgi:hypothetical protein